jgi:predicted sulfurtransferase
MHNNLITGNKNSANDMSFDLSLIAEDLSMYIVPKNEGAYVQCHACRRPLSSEDIASLHYREGVSCPKCIHDIDADRHARLEERRRQLELARLRGQ